MAKIYWRRIKAGTRFYNDVPTNALKAEIKELAKQDVIAGVITEAQYVEFIGEPYSVSEEEAV